jgi:hypothetical protein
MNSDFFHNARYFTHTGGGHGSNMVRLWAFGHSNTSAPNYGTESMPFKKQNNVASGLYVIKATASGGPTLDGRYINRMKQVLKQADENGQTVLLSLFDHFTFRDTGSWNHNPPNPWNPNASDLGLNCQLPAATGTNNAGTEFYKICNDSPATGGVCSTDPATGKERLTCLGWSQRNYVMRMMNIVKTGNNGGHFKNVIIELGNEVWKPDAMKINVYKTWYKTLAKWVRSKGHYMIEADPGPEQYSNDAHHKYLFDCMHSSCTNQYSVANDSRVDMLSLHGQSWGGQPTGSNKQNDPCFVASRAVSNFDKPALIDDDGHERDDNTVVEGWANDATGSACQPRGIVHYDHLDEGQQPPGLCKPASETEKIDCDSYNQLGDLSPFSDFCSSALSGTCTTFNESNQSCITKGCYGAN